MTHFRCRETLEAEPLLLAVGRHYTILLATGFPASNSPKSSAYLLSLYPEPTISNILYYYNTTISNLAPTEGRGIRDAPVCLSTSTLRRFQKYCDETSCAATNSVQELSHPCTLRAFGVGVGDAPQAVPYPEGMEGVAPGYGTGERCGASPTPYGQSPNQDSGFLRA